LTERRLLDKGDYSILTLFILTIISSAIPTLFQATSTELSAETMLLAFMILIPFAVLMSGIIFTYSSTQFTFHKQFRHIVLVFFGINTALISVLYFLTHPAMAVLSPFAGPARNRTIVVSFGFLLAPTALFSRVTDEFNLSKIRSIAAIIWAGILYPLIALIFFFSPEPLFLTISPNGVPTSETYLILMFLIPTLSVALWRYYSGWKAERNRLDLAAILSILLWIYSILMIYFQRGPTTLMELVWFSVYLSGVVLLVVASIATEFVEPHKALTTLVELRTNQLNESKREIEFYLNIWGHKIGNLLQSMILYLEMFSSGLKSADELTRLASTALTIGTEANQINRQVAALIKLKEKEVFELIPVNLEEILVGSLQEVSDTYGSQCIVDSVELSGNIRIYADEFAELTLSNLCSFICKQNSDPIIHLTSEVDSSSVNLKLQFDGPRISKDIEESLFSQLQPARTTLSLDLFTVKILMQRFNGLLIYEWDEKSKQNLFILNFQRHLSFEEDIKLRKEHSSRIG